MNRQLLLTNMTVNVSDVLEEPEGTKKEKKAIKKKKVDEFLRNLNALLNGGGGFIVVHVESLYNLDTFEKSVNVHMANLIPDDSPFHDNFERHIFGMNHLIFRVIPRTRKVSTAFFNTKVPQSCGVVDPRQGQMKYLMNHQGVHRDDSQNEVRYTFKKESEVKVKGRTDSVFQEAINVQAKKVVAIEQFQRNLKSEFFNRNKMSTYVPKYVSAFTKLPKGGSIFLGIKEGDTEEDHGKFLCEGVRLKPQDEEAVSQDIQRLIKEKTYWLPPVDDEQPPVDVVQKHVDVVYHRVEDDPEFCVVEIKVHRYTGMVFYDKDGPKAYTITNVNEHGYANLYILTLKRWYKEIKK